MWNGSSDDVLDRLRQGLVDLAVIAAPYDTEHLEGITVGRGPWVAIMSRSNELADLDGDTIPLKSLAGKPLIVDTRMVCRGERRAEYYMHAVKLS